MKAPKGFLPLKFTNEHRNVICTNRLYETIEVSRSDLLREDGQYIITACNNFEKAVDIIAEAVKHTDATTLPILREEMDNFLNSIK